MRARRRLHGVLIGVSVVIFGTLLAVLAVATGRVIGVGARSAAASVPAPVIRQHPSDPTYSTRAHFTYTDSGNTIKYQCRLDDGAYTRCGAAMNYTRLTVGLHVFCVRAVDHVGRQSAPTCFGWTIQAPVGRPFTIGGQGRGFLYPGGRFVPVDLALTNPNRRPITVTSVTTSVTGTSTNGCDAGNFTVAQQLAARPVVPAHATVSLSTLGVPVSRWPQLKMLEHGNQDVCMGATVKLAFSGTAQG